MTTDSPETLLQFPCEFPIKAMGFGPDFETLVVGIIRQHAPHFGEGAVASRPSKGGKYMAVTVTIQAESRAQLDAIYRALTACPDVLVAL
jgi:putative lipoic acid-binding regulatory protein